MSQPQLKQSWRVFAETFVATLGDRKAAVAAMGYTGKNVASTAGRLLSHPKIIALIEELKVRGNERAMDGAEVARAAVLAGIEETIEKARKGAPVPGAGGKALIDPTTLQILYKSDIAGMQRGLRLKGEIYALYTEKHQIVDEMEGKSEADLHTLMLASLLTNPMLVELVCKQDVIIRKVRENERRADEGCEGVEGDGPAEAESVPPASKAGGVPRGGLH